MASQNVTTSTETLPLPATVLESLASRFRGAGTFLLMLRPDGAVAWHDPQAGAFFHRFVLPLIQYPEPTDLNLRHQASKLTADSSLAIWRLRPGVVVAAFPFVERRQITGIVLLAGKANEFRLGEDVLRVCSRLGIDSTWLGQQAANLPAHTDPSLQSQARLLLASAKDLIRLNGLEQELDSLSGQLANTYEELSLIYQLSGGMKINRRSQDFFQQVCVNVLEVMNMRGMGVCLHGANLPKQEPVLYGHLSLPPGKVHRLADQLMLHLCQKQGPLLINDLSKDSHFEWLSSYAHRLLAVPLQRNDQVFGCLFGIDKGSGDFDSVDSKLLNSIANESAIYLENAMLFEDVHGLMMGLLHALTSAVDAKDAYTCGHSERVALLSRELATAAGLEDARVERVYMAGLLHDVGKIGVSEAVLRKPGKLTPEEFEEMKKHPEIGARILQDIKQIRDLIPGVLYHHERWDGKGYPHNLAGANIPEMGRIICLADCFDAMTSSRTYRQALPLETALTEIQRCAGNQFDPQLAAAFLGIGVERFRELLQAHSEQAKRRVDLQQSLRTQ